MLKRTQRMLYPKSSIKYVQYGVNLITVDKFSAILELIISHGTVRRLARKLMNLRRFRRTSGWISAVSGWHAIACGGECGAPRSRAEAEARVHPLFHFLLQKLRNPCKSMQRPRSLAGDLQLRVCYRDEFSNAQQHMMRNQKNFRRLQSKLNVFIDSFYSIQGLFSLATSVQ